MVQATDMINLTGQGSAFKFETVPYGLPDIKKAIDHWQTFTSMSPSAWTTVFMENHDQPRSLSRYFRSQPPPDLSDSSIHKACGKLLALLLCTLTGTLFIYQGQEIGMLNCPDGRNPNEGEWPIDAYRDVESTNYYSMIASRKYSSPEAREAALKKAMRGIQAVARDHSRTPVQWTSGPHAGFTPDGVEPWMEPHPNHSWINVEQQLHDKDSILNFWKRMLSLRSGAFKDLFIYGTFTLFDVENEDTMVFEKANEDKSVLVALNFTGKRTKVSLPREVGSMKLVAGNSNDSSIDIKGKDIDLEPYEGRVYELLG
jgi:oligo-1,6-glucosidase